MKTWIFIFAFLFSFGLEAATQVVPKELEATEGNWSNGFGGFDSPTRTQTLYQGSLFTDFGTAGGSISELRFRVDSAGFAFTSTADLEIRMSTTSANENTLSSTWGANIGSDETIVFPRAQITLGSGYVPGGPNSFSVVIPLPTSFNYNPANGNLLVDVRAFQPGSMPGFDAQNLAGDGMASVFGDINPQIPAFQKNSIGFVTQISFQPIPEPSTWSLLGVSIGILLIRKRYVSA